MMGMFALHFAHVRIIFDHFCMVCPSLSSTQQALDGEMGVGGLDASPKAPPSAPLVDAQLPFATYSERVESVGLCWNFWF